MFTALPSVTVFQLDTEQMAHDEKTFPLRGGHSYIVQTWAKEEKGKGGQDDDDDEKVI